MFRAVPDALIRSGDLEIDPSTFTVRRGAKVVRPSPKVYSLIVLLLRNHGEIVTRQTIEDEVWPDVHVSDSSLRWLVKEVRRSIGDSGLKQHYIKTARGHGLQWVAPVHHVTRATTTHLVTSDDIGRSSETDFRVLIDRSQAYVHARMYHEARSALLQAAELVFKIAPR